MMLCSWNVRGLNKPHKIREVGRFLAKNDIVIVGLFETKVKNKNICEVQRILGNHWSWVVNNDQASIGRIWVGWKRGEVNVTVTGVTAQVVHCELDSPLVPSFSVSFVYGKNVPADRRPMWQQLMAYKTSSPWLICGDFNAILTTEDRLHGCQDNETVEFESFIDAAEVVEIQSKGSFFSWSNKALGSNRNASRIDRGLANHAWFQAFEHSDLVFHPPGLSDHCPLVFNLHQRSSTGGKLFRFFNAIADHEKFEEVVSEAWKAAAGCCSMSTIWYKLKKVKEGLKQLNTHEFAQVAANIEEAREDLRKVQVEIQQDNFNATLHQQEREFTSNLRKWLLVEESVTRQKSRVQWLKLGDCNSKFFYASIKQRQHRNKLGSIFGEDGTHFTSPKEVRMEVERFYKSLLGFAAGTLPHVDLAAVRKGPILSGADQEFLLQPVLHADIDEAIKAINPDKAPGLDGFNACFFQKTWSIVKDDIYDAVFEFFKTGKLIKQWSSTTITLVPKVQHPSYVKEYRPIACCTVLYKIISKILTKRIAGVIGKVVNDAQSGFIPGKQIKDNILLATELIKNYSHKFLSPRCMIKVDLKKAYDSIEWPFLETMMYELGFPPQFVTWIMACVTSVNYCVLIDGAAGIPFKAKKGLRQGDPMSPFLFAIGMEYLSRVLFQLKENPNFKYHPRCGRLHITHLMFADDLLMFCRGDESSVSLLFQAFSKFSMASGLEANMDKTEVYFGGVKEEEKGQILDRLPMKLGVIPFKYLGVPLSSKKLTYAQCKPLLEKILAKVKCWTVKFLSYAGRLQLVKSVLFGMQTYWSQIFLLPKKLIKEVQRVCRVFLWTRSTNPSRKAPIAWDQMCLPKSAGGWNIIHLLWWNKAAIMKLLWAIAFKNDSLWVKWVHAYYIKGRDLWEVQLPIKAAWTTKKIFGCKVEVDQFGGWSKFATPGNFSIKKAYDCMRPHANKVKWARLICNNSSSPKSVFILWLALQGRLATHEMLRRWHITVPDFCAVCNIEAETIDHLFFKCPLSAQLWQKALTVMQMSRAIRTWEEEWQIAVAAARKNSSRSRLYVQFFTEVVYAIWLNRNSKVFRSCNTDVRCIMSDVMFRVALRCALDVKHLMYNLSIVRA